jgi:hypothetical protein
MTDNNIFDHINRVYTLCQNIHDHNKANDSIYQIIFSIDQSSSEVHAKSV